MPSQPDLLPSCHPLIVHCKYDEIVALDAYPPHPKNDNTHPPEQLALFEKILRHQGIRRAAVVSKLTKRFVTGHGMLATLRRMGITGIPVDHQTFASEEDELRHLMADNRLPSLAVRDDTQTLANLEELTDLDLGLELTGFTDADMHALDLDPGDVQINGKKNTRLIPVEPRPYPKRAWALIGIDIADFGKIQTLLDQLPDQAIVRVTRSDYEEKQNRQPQSRRKTRPAKAHA